PAPDPRLPAEVLGTPLRPARPRPGRTQPGRTGRTGSGAVAAPRRRRRPHRLAARRGPGPAQRLGRQQPRHRLSILGPTPRGPASVVVGPRPPARSVVGRREAGGRVVPTSRTLPGIPAPPAPRRRGGSAGRPHTDCGRRGRPVSGSLRRPWRPIRAGQTGGR